MSLQLDILEEKTIRQLNIVPSYTSFAPQTQHETVIFNFFLENNASGSGGKSEWICHARRIRAMKRKYPKSEVFVLLYSVFNSSGKLNSTALC